MNAALRWILYGAIGGAGGVITYVVPMRWFPYVSIRDLLGPVPKDPSKMIDYLMGLMNARALTTLGTTYGNVAYFLLGATICAGIVGALRTERSGPLAGLFWAVVAFFVGGAVSRALDAASDVTTMALGNAGGFLAEIVWSLFVGMGIAMSIGVLQGPTGPRLRRAAIAGLIAAAIAYFVRQAASPLGAVLGGRDLFGMLTTRTPDRRMIETYNLWETSRFGFAVEYVAMGISLGLSFAYVEANLRRATLRLELGKNEGETWELPPGPVLLGSAEDAGIRLPARLGVAPRHATIIPHTQHGLAFAPEPGGTIAHNGRPTAGEWLRHGDRLGLGKATLLYEEANTRRANKTAPAPTPARASHWLEHIDGRRVDLTDGVHILGRDEGVAIPLLFPSVSRRHAQIEIAGGRATITDLGSTHGTRVGGQPVAMRELRDGDSIEFGAARLTYRQPGP